MLDIRNLLKLFDGTLQSNFIPALTGRPVPCDIERAVFALSARRGGLGITILSKHANREHHHSLVITFFLHDHILSQNEKHGYDISANQLLSKAMEME